METDAASTFKEEAKVEVPKSCILMSGQQGQIKNDLFLSRGVH